MISAPRLLIFSHLLHCLLCIFCLPLLFRLTSPRRLPSFLSEHSSHLVLRVRLSIKLPVLSSLSPFPFPAFSPFLSVCLPTGCLQHALACSAFTCAPLPMIADTFTRPSVRSAQTFFCLLIRWPHVRMSACPRNLIRDQCTAHQTAVECSTFGTRQRQRVPSSTN